MFSVASSLPPPHAPVDPGLGPPHKGGICGGQRGSADCMALLLLTGEVSAAARLEQISRSLCAYKSPPWAAQLWKGLVCSHSCGVRKAEGELPWRRAALAGQSLAEAASPVTATRLGDSFGPGPGHAMGCCVPYTATEPSVLFELYFFSLIKVCVHYGKIQKRGKRKIPLPNKPC